MPSYKLKIPNMECSSCAKPVSETLLKCKGVKSVVVKIVEKIVTVETETSDNETKQILLKELADIGFPAEDESIALDSKTAGDPVANESTVLEKTDPKTKKKRISSKKTIRSSWIKGVIGVLSGAAMMALCIWGMGIPFIGMAVLGGISSLLTLYLGKDTYKQAATQLVKAKTLSMESLFTVSTLVAVGVSCASFFFPWLPRLFDAGLLILGFKNIGTALKESARKRVTKTSFREYAPKQIEKEGTTEPYLVKDLVPDHIIIVRSGQTVPVNGICLSENASLSNTRITGKTTPESIKAGEKIYAGAIVPENVPFIKMKVTAKESESYLAKLDKELEQAELQKAPVEISTNKILNYFVRAVFAVAIVSSIVVGFMVSPVAAIQCGISVLTAACPCTLGLIVPLAIKTGLAKAAEHGVNFKSGKSIYAASEVTDVVLDLNGTLTTGIPKVIRSTVPPNMLGYLALMEKNSKHPIAKAILNYVNNKKEKEIEFKDFKLDKSYHAGITAQIDNESFAIGNASMMKKLGIDIKQHEKEFESTNAQHMIYFVRNRIIIGTLLLKDPLRDDAKQTIQELKRLGKTIHLCTGSDRKTAEKYARELGVPPSYIQSNCLSGSKKTYIESLSRIGKKVAMVGDAMNDASAVAASHFGIAVNSIASDKITQQKAGAIIPQASLWPVVNAFTIANQTTSNIKQNLLATISYNFLAMVAFGGLLALLGFAVNPAIGALLMVVQVGLVLANLERFKRQSVPSFQSEPASSKSTHADLVPRLVHETPQAKLSKQAVVNPSRSLSQSPANTSSHLRKFSVVGQSPACVDAKNSTPAKIVRQRGYSF